MGSPDEDHLIIIPDAHDEAEHLPTPEREALSFDNHNVMAQKMSQASTSASFQEVNRNDFNQERYNYFKPMASTSTQIAPQKPIVYAPPSLLSRSLGVSQPLTINVRNSRRRSLPPASALLTRESSNFRFNILSNQIY